MLLFSIGIKMVGGIHYICSNHTICAKNILPQVLTYLVLHRCNDLRDTYDGLYKVPQYKHVVTRYTVHDIVQNPEKSSLPSLLKSKNQTNSTNIVIGPELADSQLLYGYNPKFQMYDKILKSDGVVVVVKHQELDIHKLIIASVGGTQGLLMVAVLLAIIVAFVVWFTVSNYHFT